MKKYVIMAVGILIGFSSFAQSELDKKYLQLEEKSMLAYTPHTSAASQIKLEMAFGKNQIKNPNEFKKLKGGSILSVELCFSDYPKNRSFEELNSKRVKELRKLNPDLFKDESIQWRTIRQTNCNDKASANKLFHGFVITFKEGQSPEKMKVELAELKKVLSGKTEPTLTSKESSKTTASKELSETVDIDSEWGDTVINFYVTEELSIPIIIDAGGESLSTKPMTFVSHVSNTPKVDSTVSAVLKRKNWKNMIVVTDVTGSMYPYTGQFLAWLKLNEDKGKMNEFLCFNDGNLTPEHRKVIGKIGGIYNTKSKKYEDVEQTIFTAMANGSGGDAPENDLEAILKGIQNNPSCKEVILIADNWAPIKDISLMDKIDVPVRVVLCGANWGVNIEYLELAKRTGGSVHTMEDDLEDLAELKNGATFKIAGNTFKIVHGKFKRMLTT